MNFNSKKKKKKSKANDLRDLRTVSSSSLICHWGRRELLPPSATFVDQRYTLNLLRLQSLPFTVSVHRTQPFSSLPFHFPLTSNCCRSRAMAPLSIPSSYSHNHSTSSYWAPRMGSMLSPVENTTTTMPKTKDYILLGRLRQIKLLITMQEGT